MNLTTTMLRDPELPTEKRMELTGELRSLLTRTEWLVETLLKLSKLDAGTVKLAQNPVRVKNLVARAAKPIAIPMDLRNQKLVINCADETFTGDLVWTAGNTKDVLQNVHLVGNREIGVCGHDAIHHREGYFVRWLKHNNGFCGDFRQQCHQAVRAIEAQWDRHPKKRNDPQKCRHSSRDPFYQPYEHNQHAGQRSRYAHIEYPIEYFL